MNSVHGTTRCLHKRWWWVLVCLCVLAIPLSRADVLAFQDENSGQLRWTNQRHAGALASEVLVDVLPIQEPIPPRLVLDAVVVKLPARAVPWLGLVRSSAALYGLDPAALLALIDVESAFNNGAVSPKGARGLMQLMPATARRYGLRRTADLHDPAINVDMGARHLRDLLLAHQGNLTMALASYNAGQTAVRRHGGAIPAYRETMLYIPAILARMQAYRSLAELRVSDAN